MFRNRRNSQKPNEELYAAFKQNFPGVSSASHGAIDAATGSIAAMVSGVSSASIAPITLTNTALDTSTFEDRGGLKDTELSPRASMDQWRLTPSILDPNSFAFSHFANQAPAYYTPTPGGMNTVYHNPAAGDLHTPGMSFNLGTPLSMPLPDSTMNAGTFDMSGFQPQMFQPQDFHPPAFQQPPQVFPPRMLVHKDSGYAAVEGSPDNDFDMHASAEPAASDSVPHAEASLAPPTATSVNNFRYHVTLNAPTAMIRQPDEIPITYLNKGQAYTISIVDSQPSAPSPTPTKYRTVIRISFEDDQQRQRPSACWQLWKEGRGLSEAHQRGGKLQAVEFVDPHPGAEEDPRRPHVELESASFDCFAVTWTPSIATSTAECSVAVRFNFLSTDFSHSKGVKGIPVRLCAKTSPVVESSEPDPAEIEVCYCKVKLFRDHGAERKLSNDIAHVKKTIDKLKQQIAQVESGVKEFGKRKRTASLAAKLGERPTKVLKHKRTWSISSNGSGGGGRPAIEDDLHQRLAAVQAMFTSTRPVSVLYLKGSEQDDPDLFPVSLPGGAGKPSTVRTGSWPSGEMSPTGSSVESPTSSAPDRGEGEFKVPKKPRQASSEWPMSATLPSTNFNAALEAVRQRAVRVPKVGGSGQFLDAVHVDPSYIPPPALPRAIACFYARLPANVGRDAGSTPSSPDLYRAIYLAHRTVDALVTGISAKSDIDPSRVRQTVRITPDGLRVLVDDEVVREMIEGQDMVVVFSDLQDAEGAELESIQRGRTGGEMIKMEEYGHLAVPGTRSSESKAEAGSDVTTPAEGTPLELQLRF